MDGLVQEHVTQMTVTDVDLYVLKGVVLMEKCFCSADHAFGSSFYFIAINLVLSLDNLYNN